MTQIAARGAHAGAEVTVARGLGINRNGRQVADHAVLYGGDRRYVGDCACIHLARKCIEGKVNRLAHFDAGDIGLAHVDINVIRTVINDFGYRCGCGRRV